MPFTLTSSPAPESISAAKESRAASSTTTTVVTPKSAGVAPSSLPIVRDHVRNSQGGQGPLGFDITDSPGADQWQVDSTPDGLARYSAVTGASPPVVVEFMKFDW